MTRFFLALFALLILPIASVAANEEQEPINKVCPVTPEESVDSSSRLITYEGKVYALCCGGCRDEFESDPAHWAEVVAQQLAAEAGETEGAESTTEGAENPEPEKIESETSSEESEVES